MLDTKDSSPFVLLILILACSFDRDINDLLEELKETDKNLYSKVKRKLNTEDFKFFLKNFQKNIDSI